MVAKMKTKQVSLSAGLYEVLDQVRGGCELVRGRSVSMQQMIELMLSHWVGSPPAPDLIVGLEFKSKGRGRPRREDVESPSQPTVSEEQLGSSEDEEENHNESTAEYFERHRNAP